MTGPWFLGAMAPFDLETTGPDPEDARIVQAYVGVVGGGAPAEDVVDMFADPGIPVPHEAAKIHGFTTAFLQENGQNAKVVLEAVVAAVTAALSGGIPLVGHNIRYDLTVVDRECRRHGMPTLDELLGGPPAPVLCTQTLSKHVDRYRPKPPDINPLTEKPYGAQQLRTTALAFNVGWDDAEAHGARYDALISARVAYRIGQIAATPTHERPRAKGRELWKFDQLRVPLERLHALQVEWAREQDAGLRTYFQGQAEAAKEVDDQIEFMRRAESCTGHWPMYPFAAERQEQLR